MKVAIMKQDKPSPAGIAAGDRFLGDPALLENQRPPVWGTLVAVPLQQLEDAYLRFCRLIAMGQTEVKQLDNTPSEVLDLKLKLFAQAEFGAMHIGNWLPNDRRFQLNQQAKAEATEIKAKPLLP